MNSTVTVATVAAAVAAAPSDVPVIGVNSEFDEFPEPVIVCTPNKGAKHPAKIDESSVDIDLRWIYRNSTAGEDKPAMYGTAGPGKCNRLACMFGIYLEFCNLVSFCNLCPSRMMSSDRPQSANHGVFQDTKNSLSVTPRQIQGAVNILKDHCKVRGATKFHGDGASHWTFTHMNDIGAMGGKVTGRNNFADPGWSLEAAAMGGSHCLPGEQPHNNKFYHPQCYGKNKDKWWCMGDYRKTMHSVYNPPTPNPIA